MATSKSESLQIVIELLINSALASLKTLTAGTAEYETTLKNIKVLVEQYAKSAGIAFGSAAAAIGANTGKVNELNAALLNLGELQMQQNAGLANKELAQERILALENRETQANREQLALMQRMAAEDAKKLGSNLGGKNMLFSPRDVDPNLIPKKLTLLEQLKQKLFGVEKAANSAGKGFSVLRSAMGFLTAMGMSAIMMGIVGFFTKALTLAKEYRGKMAQLNFAESILSKKGMDISREELDSYVNDVVAKLKYVSKFDATDIVASVSQMGAEFKLAKKDILGLSEAIAFMQLSERSFGEEISNGTSIVNAALDGRSNYFNKYGINITKTAIKEKAYAMKLAETGAAITKEMSNQAAIALLIEQTTGKTEGLVAAIEKTNPALAKQIQAEITAQEAMLAFGDEVISLTDAWNNFLLSLRGSDGKLEDVGKAAKVIVGVLKGLAFLVSGVWWLLMAGAGALAAAMGGLVITFEMMATAVEMVFTGDIKGGISRLRELWKIRGQVMREAFEEGLSRGGDPTQFLNFENSPYSKTNTETGTPEEEAAKAEEEADTKRQEALDKFAQEMAELELKSAQEREDIAIELGRDLVDIETEYDRKRADVQRDYNDKVRDINQSYNEDIADIKQKQAEDDQKRKNDDLKREQEYQNKLLEMRENYLMSLDDALHSRDARQVLKLMRQYELDKLQAARRHEIDKQQAAMDEKLRRQEVINEVKKAQNKREIALKEAQQERDDKLAQMKIDEKREIEDARLKAKRKNDDLRKANADRAALMAAQLAWEQKYTGEWMTRMLRLYGQYYTNIAQVYRNLRAMENAGALAQGGARVLPTGISKTRNDPRRGRSAGRAAEGGIFSASSPTTLRFGEAGAEVASVMPLNRIGKNVGKLMSGSLPGGSGAGKMTIELLLSPDLESRIVANSLNETANIITRIQRSK